MGTREREEQYYVVYMSDGWIIIILSTWGDDEREARDRGRLGDFARWGSGFLWGLQLVGNASGCPSPERRPGPCAVAP